MLLADVIAIRLMECLGGCGWQMLLPKWLMDLPLVNVLISILLFCAVPHPICEADGICLYFYLGMGH